MARIWDAFLGKSDGTSDMLSGGHCFSWRTRPYVFTASDTRQRRCGDRA